MQPLKYLLLDNVCALELREVSYVEIRILEKFVNVEGVETWRVINCYKYY